MCRQKWLTGNGLKVGYLNACHLLNKIPDVLPILSNMDDPFHVFGFSETRLSEVVSDSMIAIPGYNLVRREPKCKLETGIVTYVHNSINFKRLNDFENHQIECIWIEVRLKRNKPILIGMLYRNPGEKTMWFDNFEAMMEDVLNYSDEIMLLGDFNIDLFKSHNKWKRIYESNNLTQLIDTPTRKTPSSQTLLDHVYVTNADHIVETSVPIFGLSDHFPVCATWSKRGIKIPHCRHKTISYRCYKYFDERNFLYDLCMANFNHVYQFTDPDQALDEWYKIFLSVFNKHAPLRTKRVKFRSKQPWHTNDIDTATNIRDNLLLQSGKNEEFRKQRNKVTSMKREAQKKYFSELIASKSDTKSIWRAVNQLSGKKTASTASKSELSVEDMNSHFSHVAEKIIDIDHTDSNELLLLKEFCASKNVKNDFSFTFMAVHDVCRELSSLKQSKSRGLDELDSNILRISAPIVAEHLTYIYNLCIEKCIYPQAFKDAKVLPLFKSGDPNNCSNYRPISLLSILSKPLEKHLKQMIQIHFDSHQLLHPNQSGFRKKHSCHTALTNLIEQWHMNINNNLFTGSLFVDFAKAFDTIDHGLLLRKLVLYRLSSTSVKLISSFLSNRRQLVYQECKTSSLSYIKYGVPQGSVLGPILFTNYINGLPLSISCPSELFADDTTLHNKDKSAESVINNLQEDVNNLVTWTEHNHMALHPKKSKCMLITTRQKRQNIKSDLPNIKVRENIIELVDSHTILGLRIDHNLSWMSHASVLTRKLSKKLFQLKRIKHFLDIPTRKLFFHAYMQPDFDYVSTAWDHASKNCLRHLESIYKRAIKLILLKSSSLSILDYKSIDILPFHPRCQFNKGVFMYKIVNGLSPPYLSKRFPVSHVRNKALIYLPLPRTDLFMSSLTYSGAKLWNELPNAIKTKCTLSSFKRSFHSFLMNNL